MRKANALWSISLDVECPYCHIEFNILNKEKFRETIEPLEKDLKLEMNCPICNKEFEFKTCY